MMFYKHDVTLHSCQFVLASEIFQDFEDVFEFLTEQGWLVIGNADRTMISIPRLCSLLEWNDRYAEYPEVRARVVEFRELLRALPADIYVEFEN